MYNDFVNFVHQLYGISDFVPLHAPCFFGNEKNFLNECIDSTFVSSVGPFVDRFEKEIAEYTGAKKAVVCVNGTNALHLAMILSGVKKGDEILTQPLTFIATCNAISYIGAHPVFIDVDLDTMGLSPFTLKKWLDKNAHIIGNECFNKFSGRRIKACIPMHTFGHPVHLDELIEVCLEYKIDLIEDAAESLGSFYKGKHTGTFGSIGALSFNGNKTITTGGGGMLLFNDIKLANHAKHLSTQAKVPHRWEFSHDEIGYNYRMPNINAALGCAQLENLEIIIKNKRETADKYAEFFKDSFDIEFFIEPKDCRSNYWLNTILLKDINAKEDFLNYTNDNGVMTRPAWTLMNKMPMFSACQTSDLKNAIDFENRVVNIPSSFRVNVENKIG